MNLKFRVLSELRSWRSNMPQQFRFVQPLAKPLTRLKLTKLVTRNFNATNVADALMILGPKSDRDDAKVQHFAR